MKEVIQESVNTTSTSDQINPRWWELEEGKAYRSLVPLVETIQNKQFYRRTANLRHARLYSNLEILGMQAGMFSRTVNEAFINQRVTLNVIKAMCDSATAKIAQNRVRVMYLTDGGDWTMQKRAKLRTKYMNGQFHRMQLHTEMQRGFLDGAVFGTGAVKFYKEGKDVKCERAVIDELIVDDADGIYGHPASLYQVRFVSRDVLAESFPEHRNAIMQATSGLSGDIRTQTLTEMVRVIEAWHLGAKGKPGKHLISIENADLVNEEYKRDYFPFVFIRWGYKLTGFYGLGIAENSIGIQLEINKLLRTTQIAMHLMAVPRVFVDANSMVNTQHISNEISSVVKFQGNPPIFNTAPSMHPEVYQHIENLYKKAFEQEGISMLMATSQKPSGLNSSIALRTYNDLGTERFALAAQRYEHAYLEAAKIISDMNEELEKEYGSLGIQLEAGRYAQTIKWKDVSLKENEYILRPYPTSLLPTDPSGKLQTVQELTQSGFFDQETALRLLDFPDVEAAFSVKTAPIDVIYMIIEKMIDEGEYIGPEPYMNLAQSKGIMQYNYLKAKLQSVPEERLELMRRFMDDCETLLQAAQAAQMPMAPAGEAFAAPEKAPRSELMPYSTAGQPMI